MLELTLDRWDAMSDVERERTARQVLSGLPTGFRYEGIRACSLGAQGHRIAEFSFEAAAFMSGGAPEPAR